MIRQMAMDSISTWMGRLMKAIGVRINNMGSLFIFIFLKARS